MFLHLTTLLNLDQDPIATVDAQFVGGAFSHTFMVVATDPDRTGGQVVLHSYGPFATTDDARAWAAAHLTPYSSWTVAPLATPYTDAEGNAGRRKPITHSTTARPARANTIAANLKPHQLTRLRYGTRPDTPRQGFTARELDHPHLGPVVELTALGPDAYQRERDHSRMKTALHHEHARYEVTDHQTHLLVRRLSDAELHAAADRAAARVAPHLAALTASNPAPGRCRRGRGTHPVRGRPERRTRGGIRRPRQRRPHGRDPEHGRPRRPDRPQERLPSHEYDRPHR
ncbi:hypothetical protein ACIGZI_32305 [Streptomyces griseus]|uniref:hypothetical protein n=1 Tax=Streptomyces griseus TaxID=1911 RepID=UPI0037CDD564